MSKKTFAVLAALSLCLLFAPIAPAQEIDLAKAKETFEKTCSKCHGIDKPLGVTDRDAEGWKGTVARMSGKIAEKFGAPLSAEDQAAIVEYLVKRK